MNPRLSLLLCVTLTASAHAQVVTFRGRVVMPPDGPPLSQVKVRLGTLAAVGVNDGGNFEVAVPSNAPPFTIQVETGSPKWVLQWPTGPVSRPSDPAFVTIIAVGPSFQEMLTRAFAQQRAQLEGQLRTARVADSNVNAALEAFLKEFAGRARLQADSLRSEAVLEGKRAELYPELSSTVELYYIKLRNVQTAFTYVLQAAFEGQAAFGRMKSAISEYNPAFESLASRRGAFQKGVKDYWASERLSSDAQKLFDLALDEVHQVHILPLNAALKDINDVLQGVLTGNAAKTKKAEVTARVQTTVDALIPRLDQLERLKNRLLLELRTY